MNAQPAGEWLTIPEAAAAVGYTTGYVNDLAQRGLVPLRKAGGWGGKRLVDVVALRVWLNRKHGKAGSLPVEKKSVYAAVWVACPACGQSMRLQVSTWRCWCGCEVQNEVGRY